MTASEGQEVEVFGLSESGAGCVHEAHEASCESIPGHDCERGDTSCDPNTCGLWLPRSWCGSTN